MESNSTECDQTLGQSVDFSFDGNGSNAIILPQRKRDKKKGTSKDSRKSVVKKGQKLSKSKQRKLQQLQEEKEKKLLLSESIKVLEKYKVSDRAYSLMQSFGTIGQVETKKEKRRLAVQFLKAGLEVPEDKLTYKRKGEVRACFDEAVVKLDGDHICPECVDNKPLLAKTTESHDSTNSQTKESHLESTTKSPSGMNIESHDLQHAVEFANKDSHTCVPVDQRNPSSVSCTFDKGMDACLQDLGIRDSNFARQDNRSCNVSGNTSSPIETSVKENLSRPTIVHVMRPTEVEEKRRDLPIVMMEQEIMEAINEHPVVIICGETGCGKTTQVPQFLFEAGFGSKDNSDRKGMIGVTQPRRVAVLATARRVSYELGLCLGKEVGFQVRHDKMIGNSCAVKFMTDGILLREVQGDFLLKHYSVIILDEAHERSLNTDILIGMLSRIIRLRQKLFLEQQEKLRSGVQIGPENMITQLKLVLMSATLRVEDFVSNRRLFHDTPPVIEVPVRQYPVTIHFSKNTKQDYLGQAFRKVMSIHKMLPPGGVLVFVTGQREVEFLCKKLSKASRKFAKSNSKLTNDDTLSSDVDMKEINEAFETEGNLSDQQTDRFSSYDEEDPNNAEMDSYTSDSELESGTEDTSEDEDCVMLEGSEESGRVLDFLEDAQSLSSLKAAFEALAGNASQSNGEADINVSSAPATEGLAGTATRSPGALYVLPLYAMLPASAQLRVFSEVPEGERLIVVATNVAETSLTIPGIRYVVDTGKEKVKNYKYASGMETYEVQWISKASAAQRAGRAGRTGPGHCYRLYSSAAFGKDDIFPEFSCPEISKIPVDGVVLLMKFMCIDKVANFPFPTPPVAEALIEAEQCLKALEALDTQGRVTPIGKAMAQYPMSPRHSRMLLTCLQMIRNKLVYSRANLVLGYSVAAAAALSFPNPFIMQYEEISGAGDDLDQDEKHDDERKQEQSTKQIRKKAKATAKEAQTRFQNPSSDALTVASALRLFELADNPVTFCRVNGLHLKTMGEMSKLRKQLLQLIFFQRKLCQEFSWDHGSIEEVELSWRKYSDNQPLLMNEEELLGQAICAGWVDRVAKRVRAVSESSGKDCRVHAVRYQSCALSEIIFLHRWSSVSQSAPDFLVYTELLCTKRPYMHGVTSVKSGWLAKFARGLCTFSAPLTDPRPFYEPLSDCVLCWVSPTFGRHNWQLPLHSMPIKNDILRVSAFVCALLEGHVLPCLKSARKFMTAPPTCILKPEALAQRRVGDLVSRLKIESMTIDSRAGLRETWSKDPMLLYSELKQWFQEKFHDLFEELWARMHQEVLLEGHELFPKRTKKDRKG